MELLSSWLLRFLTSDTVLVMAGMLVVLAPFELMAPAHAVPWRHYRFNLVYGLSIAAIGLLLTPLVGAAVASAVQAFGFGLIDLRVLGFDGLGGALVALLIANVIFDFFFYWFHRLEHASTVLWQQHVVHHSDEHLNMTTASRGHFLDIVLLPAFVGIPIAILFKLPPLTIGVLSLAPVAWFYVAHANVRLGFGPLWWLLASPDFHRIHHSLEPRHLNKNFVLWFPIWDIVFGTAWKPRAGECPASGVAGVRVKTLSEAHLQPFAAWLKMLRGPPGNGAARARRRPRVRIAVARRK